MKTFDIDTTKVKDKELEIVNKTVELRKAFIQLISNVKQYYAKRGYEDVKVDCYHIHDYISGMLSLNEYCDIDFLESERDLEGFKDEILDLVDLYCGIKGLGGDNSLSLEEIDKINYKILKSINQSIEKTIEQNKGNESFSLPRIVMTFYPEIKAMIEK